MESESKIWMCETIQPLIILVVQILQIDFSRYDSATSYEGLRHDNFFEYWRGTFNFPHTFTNKFCSNVFTSKPARKTNYLETTLQRGNTFHLVLFSQFLVWENERAIV